MPDNQGRMEDSLKQESEKLVRSWMQHEAGWLRDYLVAGVEDPRLNLQSILSRHFLARALTGDAFAGLMNEECRFSAVMNWLVDFAAHPGNTEESETVLYALRRGADNAEGIEIPLFVVQAFAALPASLEELHVPNYIEAFLTGNVPAETLTVRSESCRNTFQELWRVALSRVGAPSAPLSVLEPACGSANDYRFLEAYGLLPFLDYSGFDLCPRNVENARSLFPGARFNVGNVFQIDAPDRSFDLCFVHDLFEHLSLTGMETAVREVCRVARSGLCIGFFQMDEIAQHVVRPVDDYYCNLLSLNRMQNMFGRLGFETQAIHVATFLRQEFGCDLTHNPNAYTLLLRRAS